MSREEDQNEDEDAEDADVSEDEDSEMDEVPIMPRRRPMMPSVRRPAYPYSDLHDIEADRHLLDEDQLRQQWKAISYLLDTSTWRYSNISDEYIDIEQKGIPYGEFLNQVEQRLRKDEIEFVISILLKAFKQEHDFINSTVMAKATNLFENLVLTVEKQNATIKGLLTKYGGMTNMIEELELKYKGALRVAEDRDRESRMLQDEIKRLKEMDEYRKGYVKQVMDYAVARMKQAVVEAFKKPDEMVKQVQEIMENAKDDVKKFDLDLSFKAGMEESKQESESKKESDDTAEDEDEEPEVKEKTDKKKKTEIDMSNIEIKGVIRP